jgi:hypothetical protein
MSTSALKQIEPLSPDAITQFKQDGFLVLPGVLDPDLCDRARDEMWAVIKTHLPRMKRNDPTTWGAITEEESARLKAQRPEGGGDPYFSGSGSRFVIRNGAEELLLDLAPRAMWKVAEQLLGAGTLVWPAGLDELGGTTGPSLMSDDAVSGLATHVGHQMGWPTEGTFTTEEALRLPKTGPVWINGQGTRGLYCTLPNSPAPAPDYPGAHSDGPCYGRLRLQIAAYIDDVPPLSGGFTVWPGSHTRVWKDQWEAFNEGEKHTDKHLEVRKAGGYTDPVIGEIKADTQPVDCHGPAGTVVLWHTKILHIAGQNTTSDVLRQATIYGFTKTTASLSDAMAVDNTNGDIWRDWADGIRT